MSMSALEILSALSVIANSGLTIRQINALLEKEVATEADVLAQLAQTDAAIQNALNDN